MEKLNLPIITKPLPEPKCLSMDDYLKFVKLHLKYTFNKKAYQAWKKIIAVNVPFKISIFLFLIFSLMFGNMLSASFVDNAFAYCRINLEKSANQDILGLANDILKEQPENSLENEAVLKAISLVSLKDIKGYAFADNKNGRLDYLAIIDLADKFSMEVAGRTIEIEVKDENSLAKARMAALEKLLKESLGGDAKLKSIEILHSKIFFNEEKENREKLSSFTIMPGRVILSSNKILIRGFLKEGLKSGETIERFSEIVKKIRLQNGGLILLDNKNGDVTKFIQKIPEVQFTKAGFSFEQISPEKIKANLAVQVPKELSEEVEKQIQSLAEYEDLKIKKENDHKTDYIFILADFVCGREIFR
ncbi:MAG: hypothetical protein ABII25_08575 [bacterium]